MNAAKTEIQIFQFPDTNQSVRIVYLNGVPWWVAKDICDVLDLENITNALKRLEEDEFTTIKLIDAIGREQQTYIINEAGLYSLILTSRKPEAKAFKRWVTHEVLPTIRKTGGYLVSGATQIANLLDDPAQVSVLMLELLTRNQTMKAEIIEKDEKIAEQAPKVKAMERLESSEGSFCITDAAKTLKVRPRQLFDHLSLKKWIYRRPGISGWVGYQDKIQAGFLEHVVTELLLPDGHTQTRTQARVTAKGIAKLSSELGSTPSN